MIRHKNLKHVNLTVFWDLGIGMQTFADNGSLSRELAVYKLLAGHLNSINFVTYIVADKNLNREVTPIKLLPLHWHPLLKNSLLTIPELLLRYGPDIKVSDVFKTNQTLGCESALWISKKFNKPLIARSGYLLSEFLIKRGRNQETVDRALALEKKLYTQADLGVITSNRQRDYLLLTHNLVANKMSVIPNYVDTDLFKPNPGIKKFDLVYVGRGTNQKNLANFFNALVLIKNSGNNLKVLMVGSCQQNTILHNIQTENQLDISWKMKINHEKLPEWINQAKVFILPSLFEGHPKALLEAMSCGLPCIGTNVPGIEDEIINRQTGYLSAPDSQSLADTIMMTLDYRQDATKVGNNARKYIVDHYDIHKIVEQELAIIERVTNHV
jgi:glycosyltransferase involved in cell wall biosynthesis